MRPCETSHRGEGGQAAAHEQDRHAAQRADQEQDAPTRGERRHEPARHERHHGEARVGRGGGPTGVAAAQASRRDLAEVGGDRGDLGADAQAGDEAEDDEGGDVPAHRGQRGAHREQRHRDGEAQLAAPLVGDLASAKAPMM